MKTYYIATANDRFAKLWKNTEVTFDELINRLKTTTVTPETMGEFRNLPKSKQDNIKDVGGFVGGRLKNGIRQRDKVECRSLLTLDADYAAPDFCESIDLFANYSYIIYSTHKHTAEKPRLRLVIPLSRNCTAEEYEAVARKIADEIGIDQFDDTTYQPQRLMYWSSTSIDGEYVFKYSVRNPLDVDGVLARYNDWRNVNEWHFSSRTVKQKDRLLKRQEDPTTKKGVIGAFCRCYNIHMAIAEFLPDVYVKCSADDRYTYANGSTASGLVVYEGGKFAYSNHATDPAGGQLCNAFDLVRIHKYGSLDDDAKQGTPTSKLPSYIAMQEFASNNKAVRLLLHKEREQSCLSDFESDIESENDDDWVLELATDGKSNNLPTIDNCMKICQKDKRLKGKIAYNTFTRRHTVLGAMPWNSESESRDWTDVDDAGLRHYIENLYGIKSKAAITDAWSLVSMENSYNPVYDYLTSLKWDGIKRLETFFVDYLGADNNEYTRASTRKTLVAAVARIMNPGIKFDTVLTLVGSQGCGKSYSIKRLGGRWFSDTLTTVQGKEAYEQLQGFWLIEIAELAALRRNEVEAVKHFTAKSEDAYRAAYGHHTEVRKRQCIFIGTTNQHEFLRDQTGNRRFLPIDVHPHRATKSVFEDLTDYEVDMIWAEAVELYKNGEKLFMDTEELRTLAEAEQNRHFEESPLTGDVVKYLNTLLPDDWNKMQLYERRNYLNGYEMGAEQNGTNQRNRVCPLEVWCEAFGGDRKDFTYQKSKEIKDIIMRTGEWEQTKTNARFGEIYGVQRGFIRKVSTSC